MAGTEIERQLKRTILYNLQALFKEVWELEIADQAKVPERAVNKKSGIIRRA